MAAIPLIKVRYAGAFVDALDRLGGHSASLMRQCGLHEGIIEVSDGLMPVGQLWDFAAVSATTEGLWELGFEAGSVPLDQQSNFGRSLLFTPTLHQAMQLFCMAAKNEYSEAAFRVSRRDGIAWFCGGELYGSAEAIRQVEMYRYSMMIQIIRWAVGPGWLPDLLELQSSDDGRLRDLHELCSVNVYFGQPMLAIGIPLKLLSQPLRYAADLQAFQQEGSLISSAVDLADDYERAIKEVIRTRVLGQQYKVDDAARSLGVSTRSFQRKLTANGLMYSKLLEQTRMEIGQTLLTETSSKLREIGRQLGYQHDTHFARAFKRICGITPSEYRRLNQSTTE